MMTNAMARNPRKTVALLAALLGAAWVATRGASANDTVVTKAKVATDVVVTAKGAATREQLGAMVESIAALKKAYPEPTPQQKNLIDSYAEKAATAVGTSIVASMQHGTYTAGAKAAAKRLGDEKLVPPQLAAALLELGESAERVRHSNSPATFNKKTWAEEAGKQFVLAASDTTRKDKPAHELPQDFEPAECAKLNAEMVAINKDIDQAQANKTPLNPAALGRLKSLQESLKKLDEAYKNLPDAGKAKAAAGWASTAAKAGAVIASAYSLVSNWDKQSDLKNVRDSMKLLADVLEGIQLALTVEVPAKLLVVAILRVLAELLDFGIALFDGDREPPQGGIGDGKGKDGAGLDHNPPRDGQRRFEVGGTADKEHTALVNEVRGQVSKVLAAMADAELKLPPQQRNEQALKQRLKERLTKSVDDKATVDAIAEEIVAKMSEIKGVTSPDDLSKMIARIESSTQKVNAGNIRK